MVLLSQQVVYVKAGIPRQLQADNGGGGGRMSSAMASGDDSISTELLEADCILLGIEFSSSDDCVGSC